MGKGVLDRCRLTHDICDKCMLPQQMNEVIDHL